MPALEPAAVAAIALTYFVVYSVLSVLRHVTYHSFGSDLGLFDQIFWNTTQGRFLESTMSLGLPRPHSYLGDHFSPVYLLLLPVYAIFPRPETLVVIQTLFLALGVWPIYLLARLKLGPGFPRLVWVLAYFMFLPVAFINLFDFHELALSVLPLGFAIYFLERKMVAGFLLSLGASFLVKEELPLVGLGFGVYILLAKRDLKLGLGVLLGSAVAFFAMVRLIIPTFGVGSYVYFAARYGQLGNDPLQILDTVLTKPRVLLQTLVQAQKLKFLIGIFGPVLGLTVLSGFGIVLVLPTLAILLLSNYGPQFSFTDQYSAPLIALVLATSVIGFARLRPSLQRPTAVAVLVSSLAFSFLFGDLPFSRHFDVGNFQTEARYTSFAPNLAKIPPTASVAAENNLTPHLSHRRYIFDIEFEGPQRADYLALDFASLGRNRAEFAAQVTFLEHQGYTVVASGDGLALLKRLPAGTGQPVQ
jgi:uncharacterized membrane protein